LSFTYFSFLCIDVLLACQTQQIKKQRRKQIKGRKLLKKQVKNDILHQFYMLA